MTTETPVTRHDLRAIRGDLRDLRRELLLAFATETTAVLDRVRALEDWITRPLPEPDGTWAALADARTAALAAPPHERDPKKVAAGRAGARARWAKSTKEA